MHWLIQNNIFSEQQWDVMLDTLKRFELSYSEHKVIPFIGELLPEPQLINNNAICIGSYSMRHTAKKLNLYPGVFDIYDQNFEVQKSHWGKEMLNYSSRVERFADVKLDDCKFLRPIVDSKVFAGKIFDKEDFEKWQHGVCELNLKNGSSLTPDTLVQVADVANIYAEYRFWIVKNEIVTCSLYKQGSRVFYSPEVGDNVIAYVKDIISRWLPHETCVVDVAETSEGMRIVEPNTLNAAGFYAGNIQKLIFRLDEVYTV